MPEPRYVLSLFPGLDGLGRGFEAEGFTVLRGPDPLWGGDIHGWEPPPDVFEGVVGGPPTPLRDEFVRCVEAARPTWFLLETRGTPPRLPTGYPVNRARLGRRGFWFGTRPGLSSTWAASWRLAVQALPPLEMRSIERPDVLSYPTWARLAPNSVPPAHAQALARAVRDSRPREGFDPVPAPPAAKPATS